VGFSVAEENKISRQANNSQHGKRNDWHHQWMAAKNFECANMFALKPRKLSSPIQEFSLHNRSPM
jgi:hypothetical protein